MFPMTITVRDHAQLNAVMGALSSAAAAAQTGAYAEQKAIHAEPKDAPAKESTKVEKPAAAAQSAKAPAATAQAATTAESPSDKAPTYDDASKAVLKLSGAKGRDAAVALLQKFGAANLKGVKPEQFADVIAAVDEAMGA